MIYFACISVYMLRFSQRSLFQTQTIRRSHFCTHSLSSTFSFFPQDGKGQKQAGKPFQQKKHQNKKTGDHTQQNGNKQQVNQKQKPQLNQQQPAQAQSGKTAKGGFSLDDVLYFGGAKVGQKCFLLHFDLSPFLAVLGRLRAPSER